MVSPFHAEYWSAVPFQFWAVVMFVFGCMVGSFLNVCIYRMPLGQSIVSPPSHCPHCKYSIPWYLNIPLVTWLYLQGKCRNCGAPISVRYFLVELLTGVVFLGCWVFYGPQSAGMALVYALFMAGLIVATFIDFEHFIIPDEITLGGILAGLVCSCLVPALHEETSRLRAVAHSLLGAAAGWALIYLIVRAGKLVFGRLHLDLDPGSRIVFSEHALELPPKRLALESLVYRSSGWFGFQAAKLELLDRCYTNVPVGLSADKVVVGTETFERTKLPSLEAIVGRVLSPGETAELAGVSAGGFGLVVDLLRPLLNLVVRRQASGIEAGAYIAVADGSLWLQREPILFEDVFYRKSDAISFTAKHVETQFVSHNDAQVRLTTEELRIEEKTFRPEAVPWMEVVTDAMVLPREAMGLGDVKFMAAIGAFLGWQAVLFSLMVSSMIGSVVGVSLIVLRKQAWSSRLPYGPYIALAAALWVFGGRHLVEWWWFHLR